MAIGGHGATHDPLAGHPNLDGELVASRHALCRLLGPLGADEPAMVSFPHGSYDHAAVVAARSAGFRVLATNDTCLNDPLGGAARDRQSSVASASRAAASWTPAAGCERTALARWLWLRPRRAVVAP